MQKNAAEQSLRAEASEASFLQFLSHNACILNYGIVSFHFGKECLSFNWTLEGFLLSLEAL